MSMEFSVPAVTMTSDMTPCLSPKSYLIFLRMGKKKVQKIQGMSQVKIREVYSIGYMNRLTHYTTWEGSILPYLGSCLYTTPAMSTVALFPLCALEVYNLHTV